jgi:hypothetical protein
MPPRFLRLFAFVTLIAGVFTLFQAVRLYRSPTLLVEWATASELDIAGFNVLRAENTDGPFLKINETLIPPAGDSLSGGEYRYEDVGVRGGQVYFYQLQEVELSGTTTLHGPIEVQATRGGIIEGILASLLIAGSVFVLLNKSR